VTKIFPKSAFDVDFIGSWLLILFGFSLPLSVSVNNIFAALLILLWIYRREYGRTWEIIKNSKVVIAVLLFFVLHIIGMLWTEDISWGLHLIKKEAKFLLLPIMMSFVKKEHIRYYISAFLLAMTLSELLSYLVWFEIIPPIFKATVYDPTVFIHHTSYNPFLAFAIYLIGYFIVFDQTLSRLQKVLLIFFFVTMSINMFITGGRAGQVGYLLVVTVLLFQFFNKHVFKALFVSIGLLAAILFTAYSTSQVFHDRANLIVTNVQKFDSNVNTSVGLRINFAINSLEIIKENPFFGVGTGDFRSSYDRVNVKNTPEAKSTTQPHNMYVLEMVQFGLLGLISLLAIFYFQLRFSLQLKEDLRKKAGVALTLLFMLIMLSDSYLLGHFTTMLFVFFSAILYRSFYETNH